MRELDVRHPDERTVHAYDTGPADSPSALTVFWQHGTPNVGEPPVPLFGASERLGVRWVGHDRPAYGGSSAVPGRDIASVAADVALVADELGIERFAVMGHSGGGPHALACGALLGDRVTAVVTGSGMAPMGAPGLDWFAGMYPGGAAELRAAAEGREQLEAVLAAGEFDSEMFTERDHAALDGTWSWLISVVQRANASGPAGMVDDDLAYVSPWGFDVAAIIAPTLVLHGGEDRMVPVAHARWLAEHLPDAELRVHPEEGHVSVLDHAEEALEWLVDHSGPA